MSKLFSFFKEGTGFHWKYLQISLEEHNVHSQNDEVKVCTFE